MKRASSIKTSPFLCRELYIKGMFTSNEIRNFRYVLKNAKRGDQSTDVLKNAIKAAALGKRGIRLRNYFSSREKRPCYSVIWPSLYP